MVEELATVKELNGCVVEENKGKRAAISANNIAGQGEWLLDGGWRLLLA